MRDTNPEQYPRPSVSKSFFQKEEAIQSPEDANKLICNPDEMEEASAGGDLHFT